MTKDRKNNRHEETRYPKKYIDTLMKEAAELRRLHRQGKVKSYGSAKEMFDDILGPGWKDV